MIGQRYLGQRSCQRSHRGWSDDDEDCPSEGWDRRDLTHDGTPSGLPHHWWEQRRSAHLVGHWSARWGRDLRHRSPFDSWSLIVLWGRSISSRVIPTWSILGSRSRYSPRRISASHKRSSRWVGSSWPHDYLIGSLEICGSDPDYLGRSTPWWWADRWGLISSEVRRIREPSGVLGSSSSHYGRWTLWSRGGQLVPCSLVFPNVIKEKKYKYIRCIQNTIFINFLNANIFRKIPSKWWDFSVI